MGGGSEQKKEETVKTVTNTDIGDIDRGLTGEAAVGLASFIESEATNRRGIAANEAVLRDRIRNRGQVAETQARARERAQIEGIRGRVDVAEEQADVAETKIQSQESVAVEGLRSRDLQTIVQQQGRGFQQLVGGASDLVDTAQSIATQSQENQEAAFDTAEKGLEASQTGFRQVGRGFSKVGNALRKTAEESGRTTRALFGAGTESLETVAETQAAGFREQSQLAQSTIQNVSQDTTETLGNLFGTGANALQTVGQVQETGFQEQRRLAEETFNESANVSETALSIAGDVLESKVTGTRNELNLDKLAPVLIVGLAILPFILRGR